MEINKTYRMCFSMIDEIKIFMTLFEFFIFSEKIFKNSTPSKNFTRVIIRKILKFSKLIRMKSAAAGKTRFFDPPRMIFAA